LRRLDNSAAGASNVAPADYVAWAVAVAALFGAVGRFLKMNRTATNKASDADTATIVLGIV
jgi:uncharacterized membrane protein YhfC